MVKSQTTRHFALPSRTANVSEAPLDKVEVVFITLIRVVGYADAGFLVRKVTLTKLKSTVVMSNPGLDRLHWLLKIDLLFVRSLKSIKMLGLYLSWPTFWWSRLANLGTSPKIGQLRYKPIVSTPKRTLNFQVYVCLKVKDWLVEVWVDRVVLAWPIDRVSFQARQKLALHGVLDGICLSTIEPGQRAVNLAFQGSATFYSEEWIRAEPCLWWGRFFWSQFNWLWFERPKYS